MGIARTLIYSGQTGEPLYRLNENGQLIISCRDMESESFFEEYEYKLKKVYESFYTEGAARIAAWQRQAAVEFHDALYRQIDDNMRVGREHLKDILTD